MRIGYSSPFSSQMLNWFQHCCNGRLLPSCRLVNTPHRVKKPPLLPSKLRRSTLIKSCQSCGWLNPNNLQQGRILENDVIVTEESKNVTKNVSNESSLPLKMRTSQGIPRWTPTIWLTQTLWKPRLRYKVYSFLFCPPSTLCHLLA